jgi:hypothetical protein
VDTYNNNIPISPLVGRCDHEISCTYILTPWEFFNEYNVCESDYNIDSPGIDLHYIKNQEPDYIPMGYLRKSLQNPANSFTVFLLKYLNDDYVTLKRLIEMYKIGSHDQACIFWQIDINQKIRTGEMMWFDEYGHRGEYIDWAHKRIGVPEFSLQQCLFGEHLLLEYPVAKNVIIVEACKTAVILKHLYINDPGVIVMACGCLHGLKVDKFRVFEGSGKNVLLLPDVCCESDWETQRRNIQEKIGLNISVYNTIAFIKFQLKDGCYLTKGKDIADHLICKRLGKHYV